MHDESFLKGGVAYDRANAEAQLTDNLLRDLNRASIIMRSIANESMPQTPERLMFLDRLAERAREINQSGRPIASALVGNPQEEFSQVMARLVAKRKKALFVLRDFYRSKIIESRQVSDTSL
jgi:hypothetical protein